MLKFVRFILFPMMLSVAMCAQLVAATAEQNSESRPEGQTTERGDSPPASPDSLDNGAKVNQTKNQTTKVDAGIQQPSMQGYKLELPDLPKWLISLMSVIVGLLGGFGLDLWRNRNHLNHCKSAIYAELKDVHSAIKTRINGLEMALKAYLAGKSGYALQIAITKPIFDKWYAEAGLRFTESERLALTHIYAQIDELNFNFNVIREGWDIFGDDEGQNKQGYGQIIRITEQSYPQAKLLDEMIRQLLAEKERYNIRSPKNEAKLEKVSNDSLDELKRWTLEAQKSRRGPGD